MSKIIKLTESQLRSVINKVISEIEMTEDDLDYRSFKEDPKLEKLRNAINNNKLASVAYVRKDGTVKHMVFKRKIKAYVFSDAPKTEKQANVEENNDIKRVYDMNVYNKKLKETDDEELSAKSAWRTINLKNVLAFLVGNNVIDLRDENEIMSRFGEDVYKQLTDSMKKAMERDTENAKEIENVE